LVEQLLQQESAPLNQRERVQIAQDVIHEVLGLGPLEPLLADTTINDILVNGHKQVFIERSGKLELTSVRFKDDGHLKKIIEKIVSRVGRRIDESVPMVDARLADGSRVNAIIPPLAIDGPSLSIRKFSKDPLQIHNLIEKRSLTPEIGELLKAIVQARLNVLISGGTGTGKTTMLNILSGFIPNDERIVTIEDAAELQLRQDHVVRLETRPANIEGKGEVAQRELVKNALRMRPDRIILGEVRGAECLDMLQAMNTGHDGSLTTVHANSCRDALTRIETLVSMAGLNLAAKAMRHYVSSALDVIIQIARLSDGTISSPCKSSSRSTKPVSMKTGKSKVDLKQLVCARSLPSGSKPKAFGFLRTSLIQTRCTNANRSDRLGYFWNDSPARTRACGRLSFVGAARVRSGCGKTSTVDGTKGRRDTGHCPKRYIERNTVA
jgi:pilus assembly protein CpaF